MGERLGGRPELTGTRTIRPKISDLAGLMYPGFKLPDPTFTISEQEIFDFCNGCDRHETNNDCTLNTSNDQARYAKRKLCSDGMVDGKRGEMTAEGFIPFNAWQ